MDVLLKHGGSDGVLRWIAGSSIWGFGIGQSQSSERTPINEKPLLVGYG